MSEMDYVLNWSDRAIANLNAIENYIANDSPFQAKKVVNEILDYAENLITFPLMGSIVLELYGTKLRQLIKYSYRIIYSFEENVITIIAVLHGKQDVVAQFRRNY